MSQLIARYPIVVSTILLIFSNLFMTIAWYGHLKHPKSPLVLAIVVSWGIAFLEYCFQVPANRISYGALTLTQLKILQEVITLNRLYGLRARRVRAIAQVELCRKLSLHRRRGLLCVQSLGRTQCVGPIAGYVSLASRRRAASDFSRRRTLGFWYAS
jgi:uncharacterized protein (DUF486 family)